VHRTLIRIFSTSLLVATLCASGCGPKRTVETDDLDLRQSTDLFSQPIQSPAGPDGPDPQMVIARVNGRPILLGQLQIATSTLYSRMKTRMPPEQLEQQKDRIAEQALNNLVNEQLLLGELETEQVEVSDADIQEQVLQISKNLPEGTTLAQHLERSQLTAAQLRQTIRQELRVKQLLQKKVGVIAPPEDAQIADFFENNRSQFSLPERVQAEQFFLPLTGEVTEEQQATIRGAAEAANKHLAQGGAVKVLGEEWKQTQPELAFRAGRDVLLRSQLPKDIGDQLFALEEGATSGVLTSSFGLHVFKVLKQEAPRELSLEETQEQIRQLLIQQQQQQAVQKYLAEVRGAADIQMVQ